MSKTSIALLASSLISFSMLSAQGSLFRHKHSLIAQEKQQEEIVSSAPPVEKTEPECDISKQPYRLGVRHIEANGIGYNRGYTTLEGFFTPPSLANTRILPFFDIRGHIFNDGKWAANAGMGVRYTSNVVWGVNAYYDYRGTQHKKYNQIGIGFEVLDEKWDFRANGYFPVGRRRSHFYDTKFYGFEGHSMILSQKREFAMTGGNAEAGGYFHPCAHIDLYAAAGPYYFSGEGKNAAGGEGRLKATFWNYFALQASYSYDSVFRNIVQGEISFMIPLGAKQKITKRPQTSCSHEKALRDRAYQSVDRQEIIVTKRKRHKSVAIDPATGLPWVFYFVDNTSHSLGTFESPFNTLLAAENASSPNDVIYVFPGDGTDNGQNVGITLKNGQSLLGAGMPYAFATTKGTIGVPA